MDDCYRDAFRHALWAELAQVFEGCIRGAGHEHFERRISVIYAAKTPGNCLFNGPDDLPDHETSSHVLQRALQRVVAPAQWLDRLNLPAQQRFEIRLRDLANWIEVPAGKGSRC